MSTIASRFMRSVSLGGRKVDLRLPEEIRSAGYKRKTAATPTLAIVCMMLTLRYVSFRLKLRIEDMDAQEVRQQMVSSPDP